MIWPFCMAINDDDMKNLSINKDVFFFTLNRQLEFVFFYSSWLYFLCWLLAEGRNWMRYLVLVLCTACHCLLHADQICLKIIIGNVIIAKIPIKNAFAHCTPARLAPWIGISMNFKLKPHRPPLIQFIDPSIGNQQSSYIPGLLPQTNSNLMKPIITHCWKWEFKFEKKIWLRIYSKLTESLLYTLYTR